MSALLDELGQVELAADYGICIAGTLFLYDYLLTFQQERALVWKAKWTYGKALFLFIRYMGFVVLAGFFVVEFEQPISQLSCSVLMFMCLTCSIVVILCAGLVLALRTWAIWDRSWICGIIVGVAWCSVTVLVVTFLVISNIYLEPDGNAALPSLAGCGAILPPLSAAAALKLFICLATYEGLIFVMTVIRGIGYFYNSAPLMLILYRDAFLASTCLLALTITDAILSSGDSTQFYLPFMISLALYFITPCRIILNLREATMYVDEWDLATTRHIPRDEIPLRNFDR